MVVDTIAARELSLWIDNTQELYKQKMEWFKNMSRKKKRGVYQSSLAQKGFIHLATAGAKHYADEFGGAWNKMFNMDTRRMVAKEQVKEFEDAYMSKEFDFM